MHLTREQIEIPVEKITDYLLVPKEKNDKSAFLAKLGYTLNNWGDLVYDIEQLVLTNDVQLQQNTSFGGIYEVKGRLRLQAVVTIWLVAVGSDHFRFVTLFPQK